MRKAIVIGNQNYININNLINCINDANDIKNILKLRNFDVDYYENLNYPQFLKIIQTFEKQNKENILEEVIFYYSGHGIQYLDKNYLLPIDFKNIDNIQVIDEKFFREYLGEAIYLGEIIEILKSANSFKIVILDSCRTNDFKNKIISENDIFNIGLHEIDSEENMLIAYSTKPGSSASDGTFEQKNGLYTGILKNYLKKYKLTITEIFTKTREEVIQLSKFRQIPWESNSLVKNYFLDNVKFPKKLIMKKGYLLKVQMKT